MKSSTVDVLALIYVFKSEVYIRQDSYEYRNSLCYLVRLTDSVV
jgi:hypothetical protein